MRANPTAGILLIIGACVLIVIGVTDKGAAIMDILLDRQPSGSNGGNSIISGDPGGKKWLGDPPSTSYAGAYAGEKPAAPIEKRVIT